MPASFLRLAVGGLLFLVLAGSTIYALAKPTSGQATSSSSARPVDGIPCDQGMQVAVHYHVHLDIFADGRQVTVPAGIGIPSSGMCLYWIHTHDATGVIHVEAPVGQATRSFTLGDFLAIWGKGATTSTRVAGLPVDPDRRVIAIVDGARYAGDPDGIVLTSHELITLEVSPPELAQPDFRFRQGL